MGIIFDVVYHTAVVAEDIPKLSSQDRMRVKRSIEEKLKTKPEVFGKPLRRSLKGYRKLRVGDLRIVFRIERRIVKIFCIGHRSIIYRKAAKRN